MTMERKLADKTATVGIIGLGYVGLPLAVEFAKVGYPVIGFDVDPKKVEKLMKGQNYIDDVKDADLKKVVKDKKMSATNDFKQLNNTDAIFICVPTPFSPNKEPDVSYIIAAANEVAGNLKKGQVIILKSTTFPETTTKIVEPILEETGLKAGEDFYLAFSPERIDPGRKNFTTATTPVVLGGVTPECTRQATMVIEQVTNHVHVVSSPEAAEMTKFWKTFSAASISRWSMSWLR